jgi:cell division protein FtsA
MPKRHDYLVGLDLGSHSTRCLVALEEDSRLRFISHGSAPAAGWSRGVIADQEPVLESLDKAIEEAEKNGGVTIENAVVGVGGPHVRNNVSHSFINLPSWEREIQKEHVDAVIKAATQGPLSDDRTVLQVIPLEFAVDGQSGLRNPLGMSGSRLDAHVQVVSALAQAHNNIRVVVNRAGLVVEETLFEGFAASHAVLEEQEREMGVAVADMGASSVELVAYLEGELRLALSLPMGGDHFVNDVAAVLRTPREAAQQIMEQYGCVPAAQTPLNVMIEAPGLSDGRSREKPRRLLNEILEARCEELFEIMAAQLARAGFENRLVAGVVLTGGLACLAGSCDIAEHVLNVNARVGLPPQIDDLPDELDHPGWATAIGLILYAQRLRLHRKRKRDRVTEWLKTLFD